MLEIFNFNDFVKVVQALEQVQSDLGALVTEQVKEQRQDVFVCWSLLNDGADRQQVLSQSTSHVGELVGLEVLQSRNNLLDNALSIKNLAEVRKASDSSSPDLTLNILQKTGKVRQQALLGVLEANSGGQIHDSVGHQISDSPRFVFCELLNVREQISIDFCRRQLVREANTAVDALHAHRVLLVLVEPREHVQQFSLAHFWDQLNHIVENDGSLFANLRSLILTDSVEHGHDLLLLGAGERGVHTREQLNSSEFRGVALAVHQSLQHRHDGVLKVLDPDKCQHFLHAFSCLYIHIEQYSLSKLFIMDSESDFCNFSHVSFISLKMIDNSSVLLSEMAQKQNQRKRQSGICARMFKIVTRFLDSLLR